MFPIHGINYRSVKITNAKCFMDSVQSNFSHCIILGMYEHESMNIRNLIYPQINVLKLNIMAESNRIFTCSFWRFTMLHSISTRSMVHSLAVVIMLLFLVACGGSSSSSPAPATLTTGGGGSPAPAPPASPTTPTYTANMFAPSASFQNLCETPRARSVINGMQFDWPDMRGSLLHEKFWIRSLVNEEYLWYDEVTDVNPASVADKIAYFGRLKTMAQTPSGKDKDEFSYSEPTEDEIRSSAGTSYGYGMSIGNLRASEEAPNNIRVLFTEPGSPAAQANIDRGDKILQVDEIQLNAISDQAALDMLNMALFSPDNGDRHSFRIEDRDTRTISTVNLTAQEITQAPVHNTKRIVTSDGSAVGYFVLNTFNSLPTEPAMRDAIQQLITEGGVDDLVLDLRYNGGGLGVFAAQLGYMIAGDWSKSHVFLEERENDKKQSGQLPFIGTGTGQSTISMSATLPTLNIGPRTRTGAGKVYILTSDLTCSSSELMINGLRGVDVDVVLIGETTCGKPYGFEPNRNCGTTYYSVSVQARNAKGFGEYSDGFKPANATGFGVSVPGCAITGLDDVSRDLGDLQEERLRTALHHRANNGTCPSTAAAAEPLPVADATANPYPILVPPEHISGFQGAILRKEDFREIQQ